MKQLLTIILTVTMTLVFTGLASASLIGQDVIVKYQDPFFEESFTVTVEQGNGDTVDLLKFMSETGVFTVDLEADSALVDFNKANNFGSATFAGLILEDLIDSNPEHILLGVTVDTSLTWWDDSRLKFGNDFAQFNWQGEMVESTDYFDAVFQFGPNPIPIPTSLLLFVTGIVGFALLRRKIT
jgi:hypothetical protein